MKNSFWKIFCKIPCLYNKKILILNTKVFIYCTQQWILTPLFKIYLSFSLPSVKVTNDYKTLLLSVITYSIFLLTSVSLRNLITSSSSQLSPNSVLMSPWILYLFLLSLYIIKKMSKYLLHVIKNIPSLPGEFLTYHLYFLKLCESF